MATCVDQGEHTDDEDDVGLDPRVKSELEALNSAAESINKLENELQKAKAKFRQVKSDAQHRLSATSKQIGKKWVIKARPYYDLLRQAAKVQADAQRAAVNYQRAIGIYSMARETVTLAEQTLFAGDSSGKINIDSACQEALNHAISRFTEAERDKSQCDLEHRAKAAENAAVQEKLAFMRKDIPRTINKAKPFYELKDKLESRLHAERQNAEDLQLALVCSKQKYKYALASLEKISDEVHMQRKLRRNQLKLPLRTPGVGAELDSDIGSELSDMPSATLDFMSETSSQVSWDDFSDSRCTSPALSVAFDESPWDYDDISSPESKPSYEFGSEPPPPTGPPTFTSSIWTRFGSSLSRLTQEITKAPSDQPPIGPVLTPRDNVVDGAESDLRKDATESKHADGWTLPESFRVYRDVQPSASNVSSSTIGNWIQPRPYDLASKQLNSIDECSKLDRTTAASTTPVNSDGGDVVDNVKRLSLVTSREPVDSNDDDRLSTSSSSTAVSVVAAPIVHATAPIVNATAPSRHRKSASESSLHAMLSTITMKTSPSVAIQPLLSPRSDARVTSKPPLPRSPNGDGGRKVADSKPPVILRKAIPYREHDADSKPKESPSPSKIVTSGHEQSNTSSRKELKLPSDSQEVFV